MTRHAYELANMMRQQAEAVNSRKPKTRMAVVSSYNQATHAVKVTYQPEGVESAWMPLGAIAVGNGFGIASGPNLGDQVVVEFSDGDYAAPKVVARLFSTLAQPPAVPAGEHWIVHQSGSLIKLHNDGSIEITATAGITYTATQHHFVGPVQMDNTLNTTQKITSQADIQDNTGSNNHTMSQMRSIYNGHTHPVPNVQSGGFTATSNAPTQQE